MSGEALSIRTIGYHTQQPDRESIMLRLTTRGIRTAQAIRDRVEFVTSGALRGERYPVGMPLYFGPDNLNAEERAAFDRATHSGAVEYIVWSYYTPIAWYTPDGTVKGEGTWHIVDQKFSATTSKHQGNLYLIEDKNEMACCRSSIGPVCQHRA